jgi:hypothetical protein
VPVGVEALEEIPAPVDERHADHGQPEVSRGAQRIAGQHAEAAAVRRHVAL